MSNHPLKPQFPYRPHDHKPHLNAVSSSFLVSRLSPLHAAPGTAKTPNPTLPGCLCLLLQFE